MVITVKLADVELNKWNEFLNMSPHSTIFHRLEWLKILEKNSDFIFYPLVGYKGEKVVGLMPLFFKRKYFLNFVFSPPPRMDIFYLGPVILDYNSLVQEKKEEYLKEFQEAIDNFCFNVLKGNFVRINSSPGLDDIRHYKWMEYEVSPYYTYLIDLNDGMEAIREKLNGSLRRNIKKAEREGVVICEGSENDIDSVHEALLKRRLELNAKSIVSKEYLFDLFKAFYPGNMRLHIAKYEGRIVGAIFNLMFKDRVIGWVGLYKSDSNLPVNDLLQWKSLEIAHHQGYRYYEMIWANTPTLNKFKSKFNPMVSVYYSSIKYHPGLMKYFNDLYFLTLNFKKKKKKYFENPHIVIPITIDYEKQEPGGTEAYIRHLLTPIRNYGLNSTLIGIGKYDRYIKKDKLIFRTVGANGINNFIFIVKLFLNISRFQLPESSLIIINREEQCLPFLIPKKKNPIILTEHGNALPSLRNKKGMIYGFLYEFFVERFAVNKVDRIITVDKETGKYLMRKYPKFVNKIVTIPLGVDIKLFRLMNKLEMRNKYGFNPDEKIVIYVGRLAEEKGLDILLNSFKEVEIKLEKSKLVLVGDGKVADNLKNLASDIALKNIYFFGVIGHDIMPEVLNCADLFVLCSSRETGPLVIEEALACGVPVITTDVGRVREFITNDTIGKIVKRNKEDITDAIIEFLGRENSQKVRLACRTASSDFDFDITARKTIEVYREVYSNFKKNT